MRYSGRITGNPEVTARSVTTNGRLFIFLCGVADPKSNPLRFGRATLREI
jgi:hypothetical protein